MRYDDITTIKKELGPGDRVWAVRKDAYGEAPMAEWPGIGPVPGVLQSSYYDHPSNGPYPPCHLLADGKDAKHPWDSPWWDLEHWVVCTEEAEARAELDSQRQARIGKCLAEALSLQALLGVQQPSYVDLYLKLDGFDKKYWEGRTACVAVTGNVNHIDESAVIDGSYCAIVGVDTGP